MLLGIFDEVTDKVIDKDGSRNVQTPGRAGTARPTSLGL
jgi:hypothetical protein